ncbi:HAD-IIIA family hydrolase [Alkalihalobacillus trypoxylicola]|uniref:D,D-heptose 1,7-bisphosphate phosphatase n=1 Tax=Alkalihalobacillus trypoxylicola TaxID=519424 RepID=A0A162CQW2_9BACI|nr:HAD-IIIA family hydrolase [Alkalihalobacillus trypoxylicola]KYG26062.1 hypothetical protein AZF04_13330 [Alkalihalobacillus trypoxylicola]
MINVQIEAIFIDRDGTIGGNEQVTYPRDFKLFPYVLNSIATLKKSGVLLFAFTNQPGISKGEVRLKSFEEELTGFGFDNIYLCPHQHFENCLCRKPSMLKMAAKEYQLDLKNCVVIGDRWTDLIAADEVGCFKILVKTGNGEEAYKKYHQKQFFGRWNQVHPDLVANDFNEAVNWLLSQK